jgi:hypothetical protein
LLKYLTHLAAILPSGVTIEDGNDRERVNRRNPIPFTIVDIRGLRLPVFILEGINKIEQRLDVMPVGQKFLSQLFVESNPSELCFHIVVLFLAFVSAFAHKKCAKIQKFSHICKKNLHFASEMERKTARTPKKAAAHTK